MRAQDGHGVFWTDRQIDLLKESSGNVHKSFVAWEWYSLFHFGVNLHEQVSLNLICNGARVNLHEKVL